MGMRDLFSAAWMLGGSLFAVQMLVSCLEIVGRHA